MRVSNVISANAVQEKLNEFQAENIVTLNVAELTTVTSEMIICTANSQPHAQALLREVSDQAKAMNEYVHVEGDDTLEWIIVDLGHIVVHIMLQEFRDFYQLESLWDIQPQNEL